jgi:large conductance mechanosensitive channel
MIKEFREFILKGNALDLAVGVIIGAAFGAVVASLVADVFTPLIGLIIGGVDFQNLFILLREGTPPGPYQTLEAAKAAGAVTLNIGILLNAIINLLIVGFVLFMVIRSVNRLSTSRKKEEAPAVVVVDPAVERQERLIAALDRLNSTMQSKP